MNKNCKDLETEFPYFFCDDRISIGKDDLPETDDDLIVSALIDEMIEETLNKNNRQMA